MKHGDEIQFEDGDDFTSLGPVLVVEIDFIFSISLVEKAGPQLRMLTIRPYLMRHLQETM